MKEPLTTKCKGFFENCMHVSSVSSLTFGACTFFFRPCFNMPELRSILGFEYGIKTFFALSGIILIDLVGYITQQ